MPVETRKLRIQARRLGATNVREMSREELEDYIAENSESNGSGSRKKSGRKAVKAAKRGPGRPKGSKNKRTRDEIDDEDEDEAPRKRGRPKGSTTKRRGPGRPPKAESERTSSRKSTGRVGRPVGSGTGTRVAVPDELDWSYDFDFREGSTSQYVLNQLRKSAKKYSDTADIREDTFDKLVDKIGDVDELVFMNRSTGKPHKGDKAEQMLRYRINRAIFDYAVESGQHGGSNGGSATKTKKRGPGRPPKSETNGKNKVKRGRGRPRKNVDDDDEEDDDYEEAPRRRGRPKGSKNKKSSSTTGKRGRPAKKDAPYGYKADGTPKKKPGRRKSRA